MIETGTAARSTTTATGRVRPPGPPVAAPPKAQPRTQTDPTERRVVEQLLAQAILAGDHALARRIYYTLMLPNRQFSDRSLSRLAYRIGAIDEGDRYLAERIDL